MGLISISSTGNMPLSPQIDEIGELLSNIAHHWRQPLHVINLGTQEIKELYRRNELDETTLDEVVSMVNDQIAHLSLTIDEFSSFFAAEPSLFEFQAADVVKNAIKLHSAAMEEAQIALRCEVNNDFPILGNSTQLLRILAELLQNAKDAMADIPFHLRIVTITLDAEKRTVFVHNCGKVIDDAVLPRLFEPYFTTKFKSRDAGVGLYMCRMLMERLFSGSIDVANRHDGVCATLRFPGSPR